MSVTNQPILSPVRAQGYVTAILGPTNTGKTYLAVERLLGHHTGVIGFPLRLLARENYDKIVSIKGAQAVALVTGEEKIIPLHARYYVCTVEAMPEAMQNGQAFDFVGIDEIQLCADPDRGHIFTDRLLHSRGKKETVVMGADTIRPIITSLLPDIEIREQSRFSRLEYTGHKKLTRLPKRSAIVSFTVNDLYAVADLIRRQRGGTAVVLGALSPRTRNAQVEMYQSGEVDFMVATDAIGMGLNMDIHHVAFAATRKFDGRQMRKLNEAEMAQIAGRAGRHMRDGSFGTTGPVNDLDEDMVDAIENHQFPALQAICWRNSTMDFTSPRHLLKSLEKGSGNPLLIKGWVGDDHQALEKLMQREDVMVRADHPDRVALLWDVCQIPDFRKTLSETHQELVAGIFLHLCQPAGVLPDDWVSAQMLRLDRIDGDVDTLMTRISHVRTWNYIANRQNWLKDPEYWQNRAGSIEDRLSDALHEALLRRFVDRRSAVLIRGREDGARLLAGVREDGTVIVEGHAVGQLDGFRFIPDPSVTGTDRKTIMSVARSALKPEIGRRVKMILNAQPKQFSVKDDGHILFQADSTNPLPGQPLARLKKGTSLLQPEIELLEVDLLEQQDKTAVADHVQTWLKAHIYTVLEPLFSLATDESIEGPARGIAFQIFEGTGIVPRGQVDELIATLDQEGRQALRKKKVKLGPLLVFLPELNKPAAVRLRALLWSLYNDHPLPAPVPRDGAMSVVIDTTTANADFYRAIGYPVYGPRAVRIDMLDRVINAIYDNAKNGRFRAQHAMAEWMGCPIADLYAVLIAMGHKHIVKAPEEKKPEEQKVEEEKAEVIVTEVVLPEEKTDEKIEGQPKQPAAKPELDEFFLRRGKAHAEQAQRKPYIPRENNRESKPKFDKPKFEKKEFTHKEGDKKPDFKRKHHDKDGKDRSNKKFDKKSDKKSEPRVFSAEAKMEDNPFAILQQLKSK